MRKRKKRRTKRRKRSRNKRRKNRRRKINMEMECLRGDRRERKTMGEEEEQRQRRGLGGKDWRGWAG